jgi:hypothetical protein
MQDNKGSEQFESPWQPHQILKPETAQLGADSGNPLVVFCGVADLSWHLVWIEVGPGFSEAPGRSGGSNEKIKYACACPRR